MNNKKTKKIIFVALGVLLLFFGFNFIQEKGKEDLKLVSLDNQIFPEKGIVLPINWEGTGIRMAEAGVIDLSKFESIYSQRGGFSDETKSLLYERSSEEIIINRENSDEFLNILWAFGLSNKNKILEEGPMADLRYGGPGVFASTGGWTISSGDSMDHYNNHFFVSLTEAQQERVENVSKGIYRPCCGNSTYFPDCNHGMAMLGLLQLLAENDLSEEEMYKVALVVNSLWFPDTYATLAHYFRSKNVDWNSIDPKIILGSDFSSASGYQRVLSEMEPVQLEGGGGCSI